MITPEKRYDILERLKSVNTVEMCRRAGVKRRVFYAVLNGESSRYEVVEAVLAEAEKEMAAITEKINAL